MRVGHATILREVKRSAQTAANAALVRVAGIDDWAWKKGMNYGTGIVDLERRRVVHVLPDRSAASTAEWLKRHPAIEVISRDRAGLYAEGARKGVPQARQVADRFHLLQNFREAVERQLTHPGGPVKRSSDGVPKESESLLAFAMMATIRVHANASAAPSPKKIRSVMTTKAARPSSTAS
ncbi:MAG: hypothetical protein CTY36_01910 [Methylocystis sp.]|jgi:hypothetical protein|nr:MAG: hypothetical protein CTY36_01910 [Methylocystis sp.]